MGGIEVKEKEARGLADRERNVRVFAKDGEFELAPELVRSLVATYPAVNVRRELEKMYLWTYKNPSRRWDLPLRGIEAWLRRAEKAVLEKRATDRQRVQQNKADYVSGVRPQLKVTDAWWTSEEGILRRGRELGLEPRRGESSANYKTRVNDADKISRATRAA